MLMTYSELEILSRWESYECECCGCTASADLYIILNGEEIGEFFYDGHFGSGEWDGEESTALLLALKCLFEAHKVLVETDSYSSYIGHRFDLDGLYGEDYNRAREIEPDVIVTLNLETKDKPVITVHEGDNLLETINMDIEYTYDEEDEYLDDDKTILDIFTKLVYDRFRISEVFL